VARALALATRGRYAKLLGSLGLEGMLAEALGATDLSQIAAMGELEVNARLSMRDLSGLTPHIMRAAAGQ